MDTQNRSVAPFSHGLGVPHAQHFVGRASLAQNNPLLQNLVRAFWDWPCWSRPLSLCGLSDVPQALLEIELASGTATAPPGHLSTSMASLPIVQRLGGCAVPCSEGTELLEARSPPRVGMGARGQALGRAGGRRGGRLR